MNLCVKAERDCRACWASSAIDQGCSRLLCIAVRTGARRGSIAAVSHPGSV
ncbi:Uncharacterised protein [Mycobacteroides abscessus subsp. abscessus]|nr:Uncharacterised protein [Mycobacteroides abscessus subsp. abscessus]